MLNELTLKNFKSWLDIQSMRLAPITGLFGTNSSGKSSVFQSLLLLKQTLESADRSLPLHFGSERDYVELGSFSDVIHRHATDSSLQFAFKWGLKESLKIEDTSNPTAPPLFQGKDMAFSTEVTSTQKGKLQVQRFFYELGGQKFTLSKQKKGNKYDLSTTPQESQFKFTRRTAGRAWGLPPPFKFHGFPDQTITYYQNTGFLLDLQQQVEELFASIYYLGPLREHPKRRYIWSGGEPNDMGRRGERTVDAILASRDRPRIKIGGIRNKKTLEECIAWWLKELGLIHSFSVASIGNGSGLFEVKVKRNAKSPDVLITDVGFGVSQILPVLALCYYVAEGSTILLEQPEIHLHPSVQMGLADVFIDVMKNRNIQIILESHSEHLLTRLQRRLAEEKLKKEEVALYFCTAEPSGSNLKPLELDMFGNITNWPKDFFGDRFGETAAMQEARLKRKINAEANE